MAANGGRTFIIFRFIFFITILSTALAVAEKCTYTVGDRQFQISDWIWSVPAGNTVYHISLCKPLQNCDSAAVCKDDSKTRVNLGKKPADTNSSTALSSDNSGFSAVFDNGTSCPHKGPATYKSEIYFFCGKTLGTLEFIEQNGCTTIFEFSTTEACKTPSKVNEIPCSILDGNNALRDFTPLVRTKGGHKVASKAVADFYINVCRDISGEVSPGKKCPAGSSSCENGKDKGHIVQFSSLKLINDYTVSLKYANATSGCSTNVTFVCPKAVLQPGGSGPILQSVSKCHYEIIWETQHACPLTDQVSTSCNITTSDGFFDLSPLKRSPGSFYKVTHNNKKDNKNYNFYMNVCDNMKNFPCNGNNKSNVAVCQTWGQNDGREAGDAKYKKLRYVDGKLTLTYKHGSACSSGLKRSSIIAFYCNESAGQGSPKFNHEDYCNYFFDWPTNIVCPRARKTGDVCRVITKDNVIYDLTELTKTGRNNWHAVDGTSSNAFGIYINVCDALKKNAKTQGCPEGSAACIVDGASHISLGSFNSSLTSDAKGSLKLIYEGGTLCDIGSTKHKRRRAVISFICRPGQLSTVPTLISKSADDCNYEFVWQTAAACPLGSKTGSDCQVSDKSAGYSFDLRPLSKARPVAGKDYFSYVDSKKEYEYQIKVCEGSKQTKCSTNGTSVGGCQYKESTKMYKSMGEANSNLTYFDGLLNLKYVHGDQCKNGQSRETHIAFLCNENAGVGNPQFEKETSCGTYNFLWYTKYACRAKVVECTAIDPKNKKQYDLSKLSKLHGWQATQGSKKFYLNVCRPLYTRPEGCSSSSSICDVEVKTSQGTNVEEFKNNLGSVSDSPVVEANGDLVIVYKGGDSCGNNKTISTKIRFICKSGGGEGSPEFDQAASDSCNYIFKWETSYACPVGGSSSGVKGSCTVQDPASKYTFDLTPLARSDKYYRVTNSGKVFVLNICGNVSGSECNVLDAGKQAGACIVSGTKGKNHVIGQVNKQLKYSAGQITLKYSGGERQPDGFDYSTVITFICNKNIPIGSPVADRLGDDHTYFFTFQTSLACSPEPVQCRLPGPGNVMYNLEPLIRKKGYWTALNRESNGQRHHYFINVCEALDDRPAACPKGAIGACQVDYNAGRKTGHSIGYIVSNPQVKNKTISIKYSNGEYCHHNKINRSAQIFFHCSQNEGSPVFQTETNMCSYIFNWLTPSACPRTTAEGSHCRVEDPVFKHVFDLSSLAAKSVSVSNSQFFVNPCGIAGNGCGSKAAACKKAGSSVTNIGDFIDKLHLSNGDLFVEFTNNDVKSKVKFVCDRSSNSLSLVTDSSKLVPQLKLYEFEWKTSLACLPPYNVECSLFVNGNNEDEMYDLSPLSRWDDNWRAHVDADSAASYVDRKFFINVCRGILKQQHASGCPDDAGICMIREDGKSFSLGKLLKSPYKERSEIILEYGQGDVCQGTEKYSAKIKLTSDIGEPDLGEPVLIRKQGCTYLFTWKTSAARPINKQKQVSHSDCKIVSPVTGHVIDLSSLKAKGDVKVVDGRGGYFMLSVCGALKSQNLKTKCGQNSGACRLLDSDANYHMNAGSSSQTLSYDKVVSLKYTGGDLCPRCKCPRQTIITFVCAPEEDVGKPVFMSQIEDCSYVFVWRTKHVCERKVQCTAFGKQKTFFIGQLIQRDSNYVVDTASTTKYFINICKNLNYASDSLCPVGVAACKIETVAGKKVATSLGEVTSSPKVNDDKSVTLTYENGDVCPTDKSKKIKTTIKFICQQGLKGKPVLKSSSDCIYSFEWKTYTVCKEEEKVNEANCTVDDSRTKNLFDLSPLKKLNFNDYSVKSRYELTYFINVCGVTSVTHKNCSGAGICRMEKINGNAMYTSLGLVKYQRLSYDPSQNALLLKYQQDAKGTKWPVSQITFTCDQLTDKGQPFIINDVRTVSKNYFFHWKTSLLCPASVVTTTVTFDSKQVDLKSIEKGGKSLSAEDKRFTYTLNIIGGIKDGPSGCPKTAAMCRKSKAGDEVYVLAPVSTQKLTANATNIIIDYTGGKSSCNNPKVRIVISCGEDGKLRIISSNTEECSYLFSLQSKIVCKKGASEKSNKDEVTKHDTPTKKTHAALIIFTILVVCLFLLIIGYIVKSPERRANAASSIRFKCKKYICCKSMDVQGLNYREVQAHVTSDDEDDDVEGLLNDDNETNLDEFEYKDEDSEDEELLRI